MASEQQSPPEARPLPSTTSTTTIFALDQGTLCEIFLRLPSLSRLVRAAFACCTFLDAVCSSLAFCRRFSALHQPPLLGAFHSTDVMPTFVPLHDRSDPDLEVAVRGADFFLTSLPVPDADEEKVPVYSWDICDCRDGFVLLNNWSTNQMAVYRPLARALDLFPFPPDEECKSVLTEFHVFSSEEDHGSFRVLCVSPERSVGHAIVFSSDTRKWQIFPLADINGLRPRNGKLANGCIYWISGTEARVLNIGTMQLSQMDLPRRIGDVRLRAGETKDGRLCMAGEPFWSSGPEHSLVVWLWRADDDGVEKWMLDKSLPL
ncbi:hypothetical protein BRADI_1g05276v3 [Brachypodium distachyon]|uniref:F-box protein AT5G49610-like beta-propeller domain-containing protein n=1 Tax=Brachypodium distachyon TaxID=15368 RepID=A0A0Q3GNQ4_BRADI|nr:hypothetical protein BRADI_1g05276v3 [Brachypodium distachyon]